MRLPHDPRARGHEQRGRCFGINVQSDDLFTSTVLIAPTSTSTAAAMYRPEVVIDGRSTRVMVEQLRAWDVQRVEFTGAYVSYEELRAIETALRDVLDL